LAADSAGPRSSHRAASFLSAATAQSYFPVETGINRLGLVWHSESWYSWTLWVSSLRGCSECPSGACVPRLQVAARNEAGCLSCCLLETVQVERTMQR